VDARFQNNGQSCIAAKRFIVHEKIAKAFTDKIIAHTSKLKLGDPLREGVQLGPIARKDLLEQLRSQVDKSVQMGARIIYQSDQKTDKGYFYPPTILTNIQKGMPAYEEEIFGPVLNLFVVNNDEEALQLANDTRFGLGASIWSKDREHAMKLVPKIKSGLVFINRMVRSDVRFPFGGTKRSGFGRELSEQGLHEFCNLKMVWSA
jgi:succinate-semialdehyde dehydrogenase/glutarate-semialdehyde dehydrogenase